MPRNFSALVAQIIIVGLLILCRTGYSQPFDFIESLRAGASDKLYRTFGAEKCSYDENYIEANSTQMLSMDLFQDTRKFFTGDDKTKVSESLYFDWAAKEQLNINSCVNKSVSLLLAKPALQKIIFEDIKTKLPMFRDLTQSILAIEREIRALDDAKTGQALTGDLPSLESSVDAKNFEFQRQELLAQREMLQTSIWGGEHPLMRAWISKMMLENREPKFSELLDHLRSYGDDNQLQTQKLLTQARFSGQRPVFIKLENESKKGLVYNPSLWTKFSGISQDESENLDLHEVMCRLQGKYGKGDDYLDNSI